MNIVQESIPPGSKNNSKVVPGSLYTVIFIPYYHVDYSLTIGSTLLLHPHNEALSEVHWLLKIGVRKLSYSVQVGFFVINNFYGMTHVRYINDSSTQGRK